MRVQGTFNRQINKQNVVYTYNAILLSVKNDEILIIATVWMDLENMMQIEIRQMQKGTECRLSLI